MRCRPRIRSLWRLAGSMLLGAALYGCAQPAEVVLYSENQEQIRAAQRQMASTRGVRAQRPPTPQAKPLRRPKATIEVTPLPPAKKLGSQALNTIAKPARAARVADRESVGKFQPVPKNGRHVVAPKETVYAISRRYGVPVRSLLVINRLEPPYLLKPGQVIRVPAQRTHLVRKGETVYAISKRYDVSIAELVRLNGIDRSLTIVIGQTLLLPDPQEPEPQAPSKPPAKTTVVRGTDEGNAPRAGRTAPRDAPQVALAPPKRVVLPPTTNIPRPKAFSGKGFLWPITGKVISRFGAKGKGLHNDGINIAAPRGTPVRAAQNGVVAYYGNELRGFGNLVLIKHAKGYMTAYAHNSSVLVKRGQRVAKGQVIAKVGSSGNVSGPQLHFEIRKGRRAVDPLRYLQRRRADTPAGISVQPSRHAASDQTRPG